MVGPDEPASPRHCRSRAAPPDHLALGEEDIHEVPALPGSGSRPSFEIGQLHATGAAPFDKIAIEPRHIHLPLGDLRDDIMGEADRTIVASNLVPIMQRRYRPGAKIAPFLDRHAVRTGQ
ncbi:hypothetical protein C9E81_02160 [Paracoccus alkanivorans]|uniref:Uncharacterized protein n=1 Tax=Paracoccus alkanivorans TaxID=2116655 RepID=A0A3M0N1I7_9RHOB|nr:hypothetical protein C9E81_02160 [Paracoccus alkanivorans]